MIHAALLTLQLGTQLDEATVRSLQAAFNTRQVTCVQVVRHYLNRIDTYDDRGPALNAIIRVNARAMQTAAEMDKIDPAVRAQRPLHCIPVILKDNFHTADMPTTGGSKTFATLQTKDDGFVVKRLREAGAIIIAKANLQDRKSTRLNSSHGYI